jgi:hypothetical protein
MLLCLELFHVQAMEGITVDRPEVPLLHNVRKVFATEPELEDPIALAAQELLMNQRAPTLHLAKWQIPDRLLLFCSKIVNFQGEAQLLWWGCALFRRVQASNM